MFRIKTVVALLNETVPGDGIANVEQQFPDEFDELFEFVDTEGKPWEQPEQSE